MVSGNTVENMNKPTHKAPGEVPVSSGRNKYATKRTMTIVFIALAVILLVLFVPW